LPFILLVISTKTSQKTPQTNRLRTHLTFQGKSQLTQHWSQASRIKIKRPSAIIMMEIEYESDVWQPIPLALQAAATEVLDAQRQRRHLVALPSAPVGWWREESAIAQEYGAEGRLGIWRRKKAVREKSPSAFNILIKNGCGMAALRSVTAASDARTSCNRISMTDGCCHSEAVESLC
jgi:hypothetical protein